MTGHACPDCEDGWIPCDGEGPNSCLCWCKWGDEEWRQFKRYQLKYQARWDLEYVRAKREGRPMSFAWEDDFHYPT